MPTCRVVRYEFESHTGEKVNRAVVLIGKILVLHTSVIGSNPICSIFNNFITKEVAKLVDAPDLGFGIIYNVRVQVSSSLAAGYVKWQTVGLITLDSWFESKSGLIIFIESY